MIRTARIFVLIACLCYLVGIENVVCQEQAGEPKASKARLFDSYEGAGYEDLMARLDNVAIHLQTELSVQLNLVVYGPKGSGGGTGDNISRISADYLVNSRGIDEQRISTVYAGRYRDPFEVFTELWLVPAGADPPKVRDYQVNIRELKGKVAEYDRYDGLSDCGAPCPNNPTLAGFADALREQPDSIGYIVAANPKDAAIGTWRRVAKSEATDLESRGIAADRIKIIFAGNFKTTDDNYAQQAKLQIWILPKDAPPPVKEAKPEGLPTKAVKIGNTFDQYNLRYPENQRQIFEGFADVLKANNRLGVCIIVRPPLAPGFLDPEYPKLPGEPPDVELPKLIERWKTELIEKFQIEARRIFIITAAAREGNDGTIETWIIPPGANLPDPYADDNVDPDPPMEF